MNNTVFDDRQPWVSNTSQKSRKALIWEIYNGQTVEENPSAYDFFS